MTVTTCSASFLFSIAIGYGAVTPLVDDELGTDCDCLATENITDSGNISGWTAPNPVSDPTPGGCRFTPGTTNCIVKGKQCQWIPGTYTFSAPSGLVAASWTSSPANHSGGTACKSITAGSIDAQLGVLVTCNSSGTQTAKLYTSRGDCLNFPDSPAAWVEFELTCADCDN